MPWDRLRARGGPAQELLRPPALQYVLHSRYRIDRKREIQERYRVLRLRVRKPEKTRNSLRLWLRQERDHCPRRLPEPTSEDPRLPGKLRDDTAGGDHPGSLYTLSLHDPLPKEPGDAAPHNDRDRLIEPRAEHLANRAPSGLQWIGASNSDYLMRMESLAGNNPGARFIVMYRPIEEVAESWEPEDADDRQNNNDGFGRAVKTWNRGLQGTRRFIRESLIPRVLLINYHDFLYRTETVAPLISRFLELEFDETVTAELSDEVPQSERVRSRKTLGREQRSLIEKHANRAAEAWILD